MPNVVQLKAFGGAENLTIENLLSQTPGTGEVRLKVLAAGINRDHFTFMSGQQFRGHGFIQPQLPTRLGYEAAGIVEEVGEGVSPSWLGRKVTTIHGFDESRYGVLGEEAIVPVRFITDYPDRLTAEQAAAFWVPYLTAYGGLIKIGNIKNQDFVSVTAASSSVGLAAIQIAKDRGSAVIAATRTSAKKEELIAQGADFVIATDEEDYIQNVQDITKGKGADLTFDPIGGKLLASLAAAAKPGGIIIEYGILGGKEAPFPVMPVIGKGLSIRGYTVSEIVRNEATFEAAKQYIFERLADGRFEPKVARLFQLNEIAEAYSYLQTNEQLGRIIIEF